MDRYVLDTNVFFNMEAGISMGKNTLETLATLTNFATKLGTAHKAQFYMPPRIVEELWSFFENKQEPMVVNFLSAIQVKSPDTSQIQFSAGVFYQLVDEIRKRSYRGLNIAEETIEQAAAGFVGTQKTDKKDFQIKVGSYIKNFRDRYRNATRTGFLDSVADLDLIVLAKELDGIVVSTDLGVMEWGRLFGVHEIPPSSFLPRLSQLLSSPHHQE